MPSTTEHKKVLVFEDDPISIHLLKAYLLRLNPKLDVVVGTPTDVAEIPAILSQGFVCAIINGRLWNHAWSQELTEGETIASSIHTHRPELPLIFFSNRPVQEGSEHLFTAIFESKIYSELISLPLLHALTNQD